MSHWNHRVVKQIGPDGSEWYSIREVFYNDDNTIYAYTQKPVAISGDTIEDIREYLNWCLNCLDTPILIDGEVEFIDYDEKTELDEDE
jgi:tetrahydromethanopterin S-methyltransferase subunit H